MSARVSIDECMSVNDTSEFTTLSDGLLYLEMTRNLTRVSHSGSTGEISKSAIPGCNQSRTVTKRGVE